MSQLQITGGFSLSLVDDAGPHFENAEPTVITIGFLAMVEKTGVTSIILTEGESTNEALRHALQPLLMIVQHVYPEKVVL